MDPSHAKRYTNAEIEVKVAQILGAAYPAGIIIPIDVDWLAESNGLVDDIVPTPLLEDKFKVAAVLARKADGHFDILVDEDTLNFQRARSNFSIAHELGHVVLHSQICGSCRTIEDSIALSKRINKAYNFIERSANYFAGALLIPQRNVVNDAARIYEFMVKGGNYDTKLDLNQLCAALAKRYEVNTQPMKIRLEQLGITNKIQRALLYKSPFLDL